MTTYSVLSLGAGVQSSVVLLMSCKGLLPKLDAAIFADTQWESEPVYEHLWWLAEEADKAGIPVLIGSKGDIRADMLRSTVRTLKTDEARAVAMPLYTESGGLLTRQCTTEYKAKVVQRLIRQDILGLAKHKRMPDGVHIDQWIGISLDERRRMRVNPTYWITNQYPLVGWPEKWLKERWTRYMCKEWFAQEYPERPPLMRSTCIGCPLHSNRDWREMIKTRPEDFAQACAFDREIRTCGGESGATYLHHQRIPLEDVDLHLPEEDDDHFAQDCQGMCDV